MTSTASFHQKQDRRYSDPKARKDYRSKIFFRKIKKIIKNFRRKISSKKFPSKKFPSKKFPSKNFRRKNFHRKISVEKISVRKFSWEKFPSKKFLSKKFPSKNFRRKDFRRKISVENFPRYTYAYHSIKVTPCQSNKSNNNFYVIYKSDPFMSGQSRFLEAPVVRMLRMRSASLKTLKGRTLIKCLKIGVRKKSF